MVTEKMVERREEKKGAALVGAGGVGNWKGIIIHLHHYMAISRTDVFVVSDRSVLQTTI